MAKKTRARAKTLSVVHLKVLPPLTDENGEPLDTNHERPKTRGECREGLRPCPYVSCKWHLFIDVDDNSGSIKFNFPHVPPDEMERLPATCALDVAEERQHTLEEISAFMNFASRERARQIVQKLLPTLRTLLQKRKIDRSVLRNNE